eukprot:6264562-Amphidinium_carterae.1
MEKLHAKELTDTADCMICGEKGTQAHRLADCPACDRHRLEHLGPKKEGLSSGSSTSTKKQMGQPPPRKWRSSEELHGQQSMT